MAATLHLPYGHDRDSLPCAAPKPLPPPQPQSLSPDPEVALTPERSCAGRGGGGILRRQLQEKLPRRQVRFRLGSIAEELGESSRDPSRQVGKAQSISSSSPPVAITLKTEPSRVSTGDGWRQSPNTLTTPIPHSTLALGAEVQAVREQEFDARQAAEELVQHSFIARCAVEARAGEGMNIPRDQQLYQGLVSLHVPEEELLSSAVQQKLVLVRHGAEARKQELDCAGPDPLAFYNPEELFTESPFLEVEGLPALKLQPRTRDPATTFFMYRKLQQWDS